VSSAGLSADGRIERGASFTVTLTGLGAREQVVATLNSDPIVITGIPAADAAGRVTFTVTVPSTPCWVLTTSSCWVPTDGSC
jgi:5'-nucleotidase